MGSIWGQFGVALGSLWGRFWVDLGSLCCREVAGSFSRSPLERVLGCNDRRVFECQSTMMGDAGLSKQPSTTIFELMPLSATLKHQRIFGLLGHFIQTVPKPPQNAPATYLDFPGVWKSTKSEPPGNRCTLARNDLQWA